MNARRKGLGMSGAALALGLTGASAMAQKSECRDLARDLLTSTGGK